jgi:hypothetical protein
MADDTDGFAGADAVEDAVNDFGMGLHEN